MWKPQSALISTFTARNAQDNGHSCTKLDSHANIMVIGSEYFVFEYTSRTCNVAPFDPKLGVYPQIPIVDGAICYKCPYSEESYILILWNALYLPHLKNNLIVPFIMQDSGVRVDGNPKNHCNNPDIDNHCIKLYD